MIPGVTIKVLYIKEQKIAKKASKAAQKKYFTKQNILKATNDVEAAVDKVDDFAMASKPMMETVQK